MIVSRLENLTGNNSSCSYKSVTDAEWFTKPQDEWLRDIIALHFNPDYGSRYWLDKQCKLGIDVREVVKSVDDLWVLGPMVENDLRKFPVEFFIPKALLKDKSRLILGETSGTTGKPKITAYSFDEFYTTFVDYFGYVAEKRGFPVGGNWLWLGPSGPHIIGKAVCHVAQRMGSMDPFSIDFDPRWFKKLKPGSFASERYFEHVMEQSMDLLEFQNIEVIFTTPVVLKELAAKMSVEDRMNIKGVHYGGIAVANDDFRAFKEELFPNAVHISGYGNTLFGLCLEIESSPEYNLDYYPPGARIMLQVISTKDGLKPCKERLSQVVDYGEGGQIVFHRLDKSFFIPNMFERDQGIRLAPTEMCKNMGLNQDGVRNPGLLKGAAASVKVGLY